MSVNHHQVSAIVSHIISEAGIMCTQYNDDADNTTYHLVDGKSIKFWNVFPSSGPKVDKALLQANDYLRPMGLFLACHVYPKKVVRQSAVYPYNEIITVKPISSLLVKPLPEGMK